MVSEPLSYTAVIKKWGNRSKSCLSILYVHSKSLRPTSIPSGLTVSLKLTRDNFLLWHTQILPVLAAYDVMDNIEQDPPDMSILNQEGQSITNPAYKVWFKTDKVVLAIINSSLTESTMPIVVGKETAKDAWNAII